MTSQELDEIIHCTDDCWYFLTTYVFTEHPTKGALLYPNYHFLKEVVMHMNLNRFTLFPKSRQMLVTWTAISYLLWCALFHSSGLFLFISRTERCAEELVVRAHFIYHHLPNFLKPSLLTKSKEAITFEGLGSRILSLPAVPDAPRMHSPTAVFWDEFAFTPFSDQIWTALQPSLNSGAKFIGVSSSNGPSGCFYDLLQTADLKGFKTHSVHYSAHPEHDSEWENVARLGLSRDSWEREMEISFDAPSIIVYNEFQPKLHITSTNININPNRPIFRSVDFGFQHPHVLWLSEISEGNILIFDEFCGENLTTAQLALEIDRIDKTHDIDELNVHWTAADPAGGQPTDAGISQAETLQRHGIKLRYRNSHIPAGIELVKTYLLDAFNQVHLQILPRCVHIIEHMQRYRWDPKHDTPVKDGINDHSMDALRYFFVNYHSQTVSHKAKVSGA